MEVTTPTFKITKDSKHSQADDIADTAKLSEYSG